MTKYELEDIKKISESDLDWSKLNNKTIFVSGGTGFIGKFLIDVFKYRNKFFNDNIKVICCSRHTQFDEDKIHYISHDISMPLSIDDHIDYIVHLASNTHPKQYSEDPVGTITTNVFGTYNLLNVARKNKARFLLASSVEIYGDGNGEPLNESSCGYIDCNTARAGYNESKRVSESLCKSFMKQYGIDFVTARFSRIFGADKKEDSKAVSQFMQKAINKEDIVLKSKGLQHFSYCYVADAVGALLKLLLDGESGEAYNISDDDNGMNLRDIAEYIANLAGTKVKYETDDKDSSKIQYAILDCSKIKNLGWKPLYSVSDALDRTYKILFERNKNFS